MENQQPHHQRCHSSSSFCGGCWCVCAMTNRTNPRVYLDVAVQHEKPKTMVFQLFADLVPKTVENFRALCTGEKGYNTNGVRLCYKDTKILKIIPGFAIQCGDIENDDGTGGVSIYGTTFEDEKFALKHVRAGLLSMVNHGPNSNQSQFYILLNPAPQLDGKHVVFGCIEEGLQVLRWLEKMETVDQDRPWRPIHIVACGELGRRQKRLEPVYKPLEQHKIEESRRRKHSTNSSSESEGTQDSYSEEDERHHKRYVKRQVSREKNKRNRHERGSSPLLSPGTHRNSSKRSSSSSRKEAHSKKPNIQRRGRGNFRYVSEAEMESGMDALPRFAASNNIQ